mmetsp:Transcript_49672/g.85397  ORF Transcript_49672/g.85397 Transcript_49672/m.85397 type:complete len:99 (+) Transcript_49672:869-1165(+)
MLKTEGISSSKRLLCGERSAVNSWQYQPRTSDVKKCSILLITGTVVMEKENSGDAKSQPGVSVIPERMWNDQIEDKKNIGSPLAQKKNKTPAQTYRLY